MISNVNCKCKVIVFIAMIISSSLSTYIAEEEKLENFKKDFDQFNTAYCLMRFSKVEQPDVLNTYIVDKLKALELNETFITKEEMIDDHGADAEELKKKLAEAGQDGVVVPDQKQLENGVQSVENQQVQDPNVVNTVQVDKNLLAQGSADDKSQKEVIQKGDQPFITDELKKAIESENPKDKYNVSVTCFLPHEKKYNQRTFTGMCTPKDNKFAVQFKQKTEVYTPEYHELTKAEKESFSYSYFRVFDSTDINKVFFKSPACEVYIESVKIFTTLIFLAIGMLY